MTDPASEASSGNTTKQLLLRGAQRFMQPIVRMMLRAGITHAEFAELCKSVFVQVATNDYGIRGRKANNSRVANLTVPSSSCLSRSKSPNRPR